MTEKVKYQYQIVVSSQLDDLEIQVNEQIENGWQCRGGLCFVPDSLYFKSSLDKYPEGIDGFICQAMIRGIMG